MFYQRKTTGENLLRFGAVGDCNSLAISFKTIVFLINKGQRFELDSFVKSTLDVE